MIKKIKNKRLEKKIYLKCRPLASHDTNFKILLKFK